MGLILSSFKRLFEDWEMVSVVGLRWFLFEVRLRLGVRLPACVCVCVCVCVLCEAGLLTGAPRQT